MRTKTLRILSAALIMGLAYVGNASAQCDSIAKICSENVTANYISDGQSYRALLNGDQVAEFRATFYGGSTYRIAGCSGFTDGNLIFEIYDEDHNQLFTSSQYKNTPYWDFEFASTVDCTIEAKLNSANAMSGCATLIIGFKQ
ncbi:MAG: hypothetical protein KBF73_06475 [Flavobacteriales bacterium]|nr:hypothetical protein [Flavobacteriales bacterium]